MRFRLLSMGRDHHAQSLNEQGALDVWIVLFVVMTLLFIGGLSFGVWAFLGRQDYKGNVDKKIADAVVIAKKQEDSAKDKEFVEKEKLPFREYKGPATYGSVDVQYPKTWSAFVTDSGQGNNPIDGYFHPSIVPGLQSGTAYALRVQVSDQSYDTIMQSFSEKVTSSKVTIAAYRAPKVPAVLGSRVDGEITTGQQDSMVIFPLRDKTLQIWTESKEFSNDFNNNILPNLTFSP